MPKWSDEWETVVADYSTLCSGSWVSRELPADCHEEWRSRMRIKARADRLRIRTFSFGDCVGAALIDRPYTLEELAEAMRGMTWPGEEDDD